jgi:hypothetical protein
MSAAQWILVAWIGMSGLIVFGRGCAGSTRRYGTWDAIGAVIECGLAIWLVTTL